LPPCRLFCDAGVFPGPDRFQESPAISTRKPPSQRPERKLDATARAIAQAREAAVSDKPEGPQGGAHDANRPTMTRGARNGNRPTISGPAPTTSTKRPKQPGS